MPTCELAINIFSEWTGRDIPHIWSLGDRKGQARADFINEFAAQSLQVLREMDHCIISDWSGVDTWFELRAAYEALAPGEFLYGFPADPTYGIPEGSDMEAFVYAFVDNPGEMHEKAKRSVDHTLKHVAMMAEHGGDVVWASADYAMNAGPFFSPAMFSEFVTPYLKDFIAGCRDIGVYVIKHTDGNVMPILDQVIETAPHAIHSIDSVAGMDIRGVKKQCGNKIALIGNVPHGPLQMCQYDEIETAARYCLEHGGAAQGGYIYSTSNAVFGGEVTGITAEAYRFMLNVRDAFLAASPYGGDDGPRP
ncbi:MAG: hypothetical protein HQ559_17650, partial [Lentisphaerae bacterium]|nr:hypothetical protein [Lentisphaerota bacterium]